jgi:crotonobetainyl-CoA:carnitine CoA-transferase CaiB-like acyl-CoA transferase
MTTALQDIKILDFSQMMAGPPCTMLLGNFGADVIKIEPPEGDAIRKTGDTIIGGETQYHLSLNNNKRSMVSHVDHPVAGSICPLSNLVKLSVTPTSIRRYPSRLGEHTASILQEIGMTADEGNSQ